jgi:hypothetical protein
MCSTAIRYANFAEYIYATSSDTLIELGWPQMDLNSREVFKRSDGVGKMTRLVGDVLSGETGGLFGWQYQGGGCPAGCGKREDGLCGVLEEEGHDEL